MAYSVDIIEWSKKLAAQPHEACAAGDYKLGELHCVTDCSLDRAPRYIAPFYGNEFALRITPRGELRIFGPADWVADYSSAVNKADDRKRGWWAARCAVIRAYFPRIPGVPAFEDDYAL